MHPVGRAVRATIIRPGHAWRIPFGLARGLCLEVDPRAPLHTYIGTAEIEIARYIKRFANPGFRCFDVGGHDGYYAMVLARLTSSEVISFEFDETSVARMRRNLTLNPQVAGNIRIVQTYVAHEHVEQPRADTLDSLIEVGETFAPDLIKIDVEGAEASVLTGARRLLTTQRPHVVLETHSAALEEECIEILRSADYVPAVVDQRRWLREDRGTGQNRWLVAEGTSRAAP
jgi:FkbM family methyltransferase